jgi:hypothetical protein
MRDRSQSKSGLDKSLTKGGAGAHSWGSVANEFDNVRAGELDASLENDLDLHDEERDEVHFDTVTGTIVGSFPGGPLDNSSESDVASVNNEGNKTMSTSPGAGGSGRRRSDSTMSTGSAGVTDSERANARNFRTGSFNGHRNDIDLASIARTSSAVSGSPPTDYHMRASTNFTRGVKDSNTL